MCTAAAYTSASRYFGRNLDAEFSLDEAVTVSPRNFTFRFRHASAAKNHPAIIGMAHVSDGYPLYYDAVNEAGLAMAGLRFTHGLKYYPIDHAKKNIAPFEFIPWILCRCTCISEAEKLLEITNIANLDFSQKYPAAPLHWMISDKTRSVVVESTETGLNVYQNPAEILTNNPNFPFHLHNLNNYQALTANDPKNCFSKNLELTAYSRGMGALGLPGDFSSMSRFVRASFVKSNLLTDDNEASAVGGFFKILDSVSQYRGCVKLPDGNLEYTRYSCCMNLNHGIYYYKTYENSGITAVNMHREDLDSRELISYPLSNGQQILRAN